MLEKAKWYLQHMDLPTPHVHVMQKTDGSYVYYFLRKVG